MIPIKTRPGVYYHIVVSNRDLNQPVTSTKSQHLAMEHDSESQAKKFLEQLVLDELEILNDCKMGDIGDAMVMSYRAYPYKTGEFGFMIANVNAPNCPIAQYTLYPCEIKNSRDGRPRWFYRGYIIQTNSRKTRFGVMKDEKPSATTPPDKTPLLVIRNSLYGALAYVDDELLWSNQPK